MGTGAGLFEIKKIGDEYVVIKSAFEIYKIEFFCFNFSVIFSFV